MNSLQAAAVDIDGVLVTDTFSPVIKAMVEQFGGVYDREVERHVFSQNRHKAARYLLDRLALSLGEDEFLDLYFHTRDQWIRDHGGGLNPGIGPFLDTLQRGGLRLICYGGLSQAYFDQELGPWTGRFERYVCTNDFRPGVTQIVHDVFQLNAREVLFIDDVSRVAEAAREAGSPFLGMPAPWSWGHQRLDMERLGVPFLIHALADLTPSLLGEIDDRNETGYWRSA